MIHARIPVEPCIINSDLLHACSCNVHGKFHGKLHSIKRVLKPHKMQVMCMMHAYCINKTSNPLGKILHVWSIVDNRNKCTVQHLHLALLRRKGIEQCALHNCYIERQRVTAVRKNQFGLKWELMELNYLFDHKCNPVCVDMKLKPYPWLYADYWDSTEENLQQNSLIRIRYSTLVYV